MYAFLDTSGAVLATTDTPTTLTEAQAQHPTTTEVVSNAPGGLHALGNTEYERYSQRFAGDGSSEDHYQQFFNLAGLQSIRISEINARTAELLRTATFDYDGKTFCLDSKSLQKWIGLKAMADVAAVWPVTISAKTGEYSLTQAKVVAFATAAFSAVQSIKDAGRALRLQIEAATTGAEVHAVQDNR